MNLRDDRREGHGLAQRRDRFGRRRSLDVGRFAIVRARKVQPRESAFDFRPPSLPPERPSSSSSSIFASSIQRLRRLSSSSSSSLLSRSFSGPNRSINSGILLTRTSSACAVVTMESNPVPRRLLEDVDDAFELVERQLRIVLPK